MRRKRYVDAFNTYRRHLPYHHSCIMRNMNRTLVEMVRTMLSFHIASLGDEELNTTIYIRNRRPTRVKSITSHAGWTGNTPSISHMKPFGCLAHVLIPHAHRDHKRVSKSFTRFMVGYSDQSKAYWVLQSHNREIIIARNGI
ncbi:hypothetical protein V1527DRAFT_125071 [Lipomyces starkeyi]